MPDKIQAIEDWPTPHCLRDVQAFLGLASYYRKLVKGFATIAEQLTALIKKMAQFTWTPKAWIAFESLKTALMDDTSLAFQVPYLSCTLDTDVSDVAIGAVLSQNADEEKHPIAFFLRVMNSSQKTVLYHQERASSGHFSITAFPALPYWKQGNPENRLLQSELAQDIQGS